MHLVYGRKKVFSLFFGSTSLVLCSAFVSNDIGILFFSLGIVVSLVQMLPGSGFLDVTPDGLTVCSLFKKRTIRWCEIAPGSFRVISLPLTPIKTVGWDYKKISQYKHVSLINKKLTGREAGLPDTYGLPVKELADLLNKIQSIYGKE